MALASLSVDLDSLPHYCRIHSLDEAILDERSRRSVYELAVPRFLELFAELGIGATFFAIGEDLASPEAAQSLAAAHRAGVEVGNHSLHHRYELSRLSPEEIALEVEGAQAAIAAATGERPVGFRAPGYTLSPPLYQALLKAGFVYDSSSFPSVPYYTAKAVVLGAMGLFGRRSRSILDTPRVLASPLDPYQPDPEAPYRRGAGEVLELPISVARWTRLPFIGTFVLTAPLPVVKAAYRATRGPLLNFELHAVDLLGEEDGLPAPLVARQRDLGVSWRRKRDRLVEVMGWIARDRQVVTLAKAAYALRPR